MNKIQEWQEEKKELIKKRNVLLEEIKPISKRISNIDTYIWIYNKRNNK